MDKYVLNTEVTAFLDVMNHPLRDLIENLRRVILTAGLIWGGHQVGMD